MIEIDVPGFKKFHFDHLVLDVNGTIAENGELIDGVAKILADLRSRVEVHLVTADTHGKQEAINADLSLQAVLIPARNQAKAKLEFIESLGKEHVAAIGNGANDAEMLQHAALGILVIGPEGSAVEALLKADIVVGDVRQALELLTHPKRLAATLRR